VREKMYAPVQYEQHARKGAQQEHAASDLARNDLTETRNDQRAERCSRARHPALARTWLRRIPPHLLFLPPGTHTDRLFTVNLLELLIGHTAYLFAGAPIDDPAVAKANNA
jgi:hypothetical protein